MQSISTERRHRAAKLSALALAALLSQGFYCNNHHDPPTLPDVTLTDIHLKIADPATGAAVVSLTWSYPDTAHVSYFQIFAGVDKDSLKHSLITQVASDTPQASVPLPDSTRPFTMYFGVLAVWVEPTGQKESGDTLLIDSLKITPSLTILDPSARSYLSGRVLQMQVQTNSDPGVMLRMSLFEKDGSSWSQKQDTCLPLDGCDKPIFGPSLQKDSLVLQQTPVGDTTEALFCVLGIESFQTSHTGQWQSLGCSRFFRVGQ